MNIQERPEFTDLELKRLVPVINEVTDLLLRKNQKTDFMMVTDQSRIVEQYKKNYSRKDEISTHEILLKNSPYKLFYIWTRNALEKTNNQILNLKCFSKGLIPERIKLLNELKYQS